MKENLYKILFHLLSFYPKKKKALIIDIVKLDDNALELANYLAQNFDFEVGIMLSGKELKSLENNRSIFHPLLNFMHFLI